ncbi:MAG: rane protein [Xanthomonadaceae bacterium]|nr:rane protein [Xanthomonadaceae bacterium]
MSDFNETLVPPPVPTGTASQEDKTLALLTHLSGIVLCFIVPLIVWLTHKDKADKPFLNDQAKEALNFQITMFIVYLVCKVLILIVIGFFLLPVAWIVNLIFCILAGLKANEGVAYRYPFAIRLIK